MKFSHHSELLFVLLRFLSDFLELLLNYQTLISGILAVIAAVFTIKKLNEQIKQTEKIEQERYVRREKAFRSVLPLNLTEIVEYTQIYSSSIKSIYDEDISCPNEFINLNKMNIPVIPELSIKTIQSYIEASSNELVIKRLQEIIQKIMMVHSNFRIIVTEDTPVMKEILYIYLINLAEIHQKAYSMYEFARFEKDYLEEINPQSIMASLACLGWYQNRYEDLYKKADELKTSGRYDL